MFRNNGFQNRFLKQIFTPASGRGRRACGRELLHSVLEGHVRRVDVGGARGGAQKTKHCITSIPVNCPHMSHGSGIFPRAPGVSSVVRSRKLPACSWKLPACFKWPRVPGTSPCAPGVFLHAAELSLRSESCALPKLPRALQEFPRALPKFHIAFPSVPQCAPECHHLLPEFRRVVPEGPRMIPEPV